MTFLRFPIIGKVLAFSLLLAGTAFAEDNTVTIIDGVSSNVSGNYYVGNSGTNNTLLIINGGSLSNSQSTYIGHLSTANDNHAFVTGTGSTWLTGSGLSVGEEGSGNALTISSNARVFCGGSFNISHEESSSNNIVTVSGSGSTLRVPEYYIMLGSSKGSGGRLVIEDEASAYLRYLTVGADGSGHSALITGSGTTLTSSYELTIGSFGSDNQMIINSGAWVHANSIEMATHNGGDSNRLVISDATLSMSNSLEIGRSASYNTLIVTNGGTIGTPDRIELGAPYSSGPHDNNIHVSGTGSVISTEFLSVSEGSWGSLLQIDQGARFTTENTYLGAENDSSSNSMIMVVGAGSMFTNTGMVRIEGTNHSVIVRDGGQFITDNTRAEAAGAHLEISGPGSVWRQAGDFYAIGADQNLVITNGGLLSCDDLDLHKMGATSTLRITGIGSLLEADNVDIGGSSGSLARVYIENGGCISSRSGAMGWLENNYGSIVVVSGTGSSWTNQQTLNIGGWYAHDQLLLLTNGGSAWARIVQISGSDGGYANRIVIHPASHLGVLETCYVWSGTNELSGGSMYAAELYMTNVSAGFDFNSGRLGTRQALVSNMRPFIAGNGVDTAEYDIMAGPASGHRFYDSLVINTNATLQGDGIVVSGVTEIVNGAVLQPGGTGQIATLTFDDLLLRSGSTYDFELGMSTDLVEATDSLTSDWNGVCSLKLHELAGANWAQTNVFLRFATNATRMVWDIDRTDVPAATNIGVWQTATGMALVPIQAHCVAKDGLHLPLYENWVKAATNIPAALAEKLGGIPILVSNGIWHTGGSDVSGHLATWDNIVIQDAPDASDVQVCAGVTGTDNLLIVRNGATVSFDAFAVSRYSSASNNSAVIQHVGTVVNGTDLYAGWEGGNSILTITNGGTAAGSQSYIGFATTADGNVVRVLGAGSVLTNSQDLFVGYFGADNRLELLSGGYAICDEGFVGWDPPAINNEALIDASLWECRKLKIGRSGNDNTLTITNGGQALSQSGYIGETGATGNTAHVTGSGSTWTNTLALFVGDGGTDSRLEIYRGASAYAPSISLGGASGSQNSTIYLEGINSTLSAGDLVVGGSGSGNRLRAMSGTELLAENVVIGENASAGDSRMILDLDSECTIANVCEVRHGTNELAGGTMYAERLIWTNALGGFDFNSGWLSTKESLVDVSEPFMVGHGADSAIYELQSGSPSGHIFASSLLIHYSALLRGDGTVSSGLTELVNGATLQPGGTGQTATLTFDDLLLREGAIYDFELGMSMDLVEVTDALTSDWHGVCTLKLHELAGANWAQTNVFLRFATNSTRMVWDIDRTDVPAATNIGVWQTPTEMALAPIDHHCVAKDGLHLPLYENWVKAATNLPAAVAEVLSGIPIFVSNGVWHTGGGQVSGSTLVLDDIDVQSAPDASSVEICAGLTGSGNRLVLQNGATLSSLDFSISRMPSANSNTTEVNGSTSLLYSDNLYVGREGSSANLTAENGGRIEGDVSYIGFASSAGANIARITGSGSVWTNTSDLFVGYFGADNRLEILNDGYVVCDEGFVGWDPPAINNEALVDASRWECRKLKVGRSGNDNVLTVTNGGTAFSQSGYIGETGATGNTAHVTGSGSMWTNTLALFVGDGGTDSRLELYQGASVYAPSLSRRRRRLTGQQHLSRRHEYHAVCR